MSDQTQQALHTQGAIGDYFVLQNVVLSTRTADAYKAIDKSRNTPIILWTLRHPLVINSDAVRRFLGRLYSMMHAGPHICDLGSYGVDQNGVAFAIFPSLDGHPITQGNIDFAEAERRFLSALRIVSKLHDAGIVCGDLCGASFWVTRSGELQFIGVMGTFDAEAAATAMVPPAETVPFLAPEQRSGGALDQTTDCFALGVLGYYLFTKTYPFGEGAAVLLSNFNVDLVRPIGSFVKNPAPWIEEILFRCIDPDPSRRYSSATEVIAAIADLKGKISAGQSLPVRTKKSGAADLGTLLSKDGRGVVAADQGSVPDLRGEAKPPAKIGPFKVKTVGMVGIALLSAAIVILLPRLFSPDPNQRNLKSDLAIHQSAVGSGELKQALNVISEEKVSIEDKKAELDKAVNSDDPLAHEILVKSARDAHSKDLRELSEKAIIERARRLGLSRSAEQVRQWLRSIRGDELPAEYEPVLQTLNKTLPIEARSSVLRQAYGTNPRLALRLSVSLALDTGSVEEFQPVLSQLIGDSLKLEGAKDYSALSLILASSELALVFGEDVIQRRDQIPDKDVAWLLKILADRNDVNVRAVATMAVQRGILPPIKGYFLSVVRDRGDLPNDVLNALIRSAGGALSIEDVTTFGRWIDLDSEKVLSAIMADSTDPAVLVEAFDILSGKGIQEEQLQKLVEWIRRNYWERRADFAHTAGVLAHADLVDAAEIESSLAAFDKFARDSELMNILTASKSPQAQRAVIAKYGATLGLGRVLNMISSGPKEVRIAGIQSLKGFNDIGALKLIIEHYEKEKDPDVKQVYKDTFWVIKERE